MRLLQWMIGLATVAVCGVGTVWLLSPGEVQRLRSENEELARQSVELQRAIDRLTGEDRAAEVHVLDQVQAGEIVNGRPVGGTITTIEFIELDRDQHPLPSQRFIIEDDWIFFDALVIKFDHEYVAAGDQLRGKSLALFRRIYGEHQNPADGFPIDRTGDVPEVFRLEGEPNPYEGKLWSMFWDYAANPKLADRDGVRIAQGEAVYQRMRRGEVWTLSLQNNGGLNIKLHRPGAEAASRPAAEISAQG